jgi:hypothetical protein
VAIASTATPSATQTLASESLQFTDITQRAGIKFKHNTGEFGIKLMPESVGSGVAFIDYNNDGYQDIFFVNSRDWTDAEIRDYQYGKWNAVEIEHSRINMEEMHIVQVCYASSRRESPRDAVQVPSTIIMAMAHFPTSPVIADWTWTYMVWVRQ